MHNENALPFVGQRPTTNPIMPVDDVAVAADFYRRLGFEVETYDDGYAWVKHCGWEWLHLRRVDGLTSNEASAYLHVDDADAWHAAMVEASGGEIEVGPVETQPWAMREFAVRDPDGNLIRLGQNV